MDSFIRKGFYTIGALKTNRIIYPCGIRQKASAFALHLRKIDSAVSLVTVGGREYYVYRYEGELNDIPNAVVLISYPKNAFGTPKALRYLYLPMWGYPPRKSLAFMQDGGQLNYFSGRVKGSLLWINIRSDPDRGWNVTG